jgi:hypothetical protein
VYFHEQLPGAKNRTLSPDFLQVELLAFNSVSLCAPD